MGTRASFWVGDPRNIDERKWLGCIGWDGYPDGLPVLANCANEQEFVAAVAELAERDDFATPEGGWPYPWDDDIFVTDYTYAWFDGEIQVACFHSGFKSLREVLDFRPVDDNDDLWPEIDDSSCTNVPAPTKWAVTQPDSIIIVGG